MRAMLTQTFSPSTGENRQAWRLARLAGLREGGAVALTLSRLRLIRFAQKSPLPSPVKGEGFEGAVA